MTIKTEKRDLRIHEFVVTLSQLDAGARARLRRNAGRTLNDARDAQSTFFQALPYGVAERNEDTFFLVATLFASSHQEVGGKGSLGAALGQLRRERMRENEDRAGSLDRRFQALLVSETDQLPFRLRQLMRLLASNEIAVDWEQLLFDLLRWDSDSKWVQLNWARDYFVNRPFAGRAESQTSE